jgi:uncharacterized RDD family membrane protein YckC
MDPLGVQAVEGFVRLDPRAPFLRRWFAGSIDLLLSFSAILLVNRLVPPELHSENPWLGTTLALLLFPAYFWLPEAIWGATPGKRLTGVRVIDAQGRAPGARRAFIRTVTRVLEVNPFLFGAIPAALIAYRSRTGQRLGDMLAKTFVVKASDLPKLASASTVDPSPFPT